MTFEPSLTKPDSLEPTSVEPSVTQASRPSASLASASAFQATSAAEAPEEMAMALKGQLEAVLFLTNRPLALQELAELVGASVDTTEEALVDLIQDYAFRSDSALEINDEDGYILQVRGPYSALVHQLIPMNLSAATVRTLSAIAIKAPLLQSELIELRGSSAYDHIQELLAHQLVSKKRQGRSYLLSVTPRFHEHFKLAADPKDLTFLVERTG